MAHTNGREYGFSITEREMEVYQALLTVGACTISKLSKHVGLDQRSTYDYIERLIYKGLVGQVWQNKKRLFLGLNPHILRREIDDEKNQVINEFSLFETELRNQQPEQKLNYIVGLKSMLTIIRHTVILLDGKLVIYCGKRSTSLLKKPYFVNLIKSRKVKPVLIDEDVLIIMTDDFFLLYAIPEEQGFFLRDAAFSQSMKRYINASS